jgi:hypothetical protein
MSLREIERVYLGADFQYEVVYRYKTYEDGEEIIESCILLPSGHPYCGLKKGAKEFQGRFVLPLLLAAHGKYRTRGEDPDSWWLVFADEALTENGREQLSLEDLKRRAVPKLIAELENAAADSTCTIQTSEELDTDRQ